MTEKKIVDDHLQKYVRIKKSCFGIEIADDRLRFLQTKHLQCRWSEVCCFFPRLVYRKRPRKYLPFQEQKIQGDKSSLLLMESLSND